MARAVMSDIKRDHIHKLLSKGKRVDGRTWDEFRQISIETRYVESAEGSARVKLGNTDVLVGVKMQTGTPFEDTPDKGVLATNAELIPLASPTFESGPPDEDSIELARVVDRGIRESEMIDLSSLCITPKEEVWMCFVDVYVLDYDGNLFDAAFLGAVAALKTAVVPAATYGKGENFPLPTKSTPISCTAVQIENSILLDPTLDEEKVADARLTVTTDENGDLRAMQKGLDGSLTLEQVRKIIETSQKLGKELRKLVG
ncbi:MAG: exosome complex protein Rrp42 [Methanomassiliicoccales archaeon]|nr:exosome complex protein Rrp42 [Methanomassiliicoccales archaeon]MDD1773366.1 exosome complex protein Rrp42 [Methanomassiliicoccales archaeon]